jgi:hypothetical protein
MVYVFIWGVPKVQSFCPALAAILAAVCFVALFYFFRMIRHWIHDIEIRLANNLPLYSQTSPSSIIAERVVVIQGSTNIRVNQTGDRFSRTDTRQARF